MGDDLLALTEAGLYCAAGRFYVDPWRPVERAIITHAHADHARPGCQHYLATACGERLLRTRLGADLPLQVLPYGESLTHNQVTISLHPAGHVLGSAQVRLEYQGRVAVVAGDYKLAPDPTCEPFEPVRCHRFVTESTFGLPIYHWEAPEVLQSSINSWWQSNADAGRPSLLFGYALGKSQRVLAGLDPSIGAIYQHGAVAKLTADYRATGVQLPPALAVNEAPAGTQWDRAIILAPPSALATPWTRRFTGHATGNASGWMRIRGTRRRKALDRGFVVSDHADWPGLLSAIAATGASEIWVTHGYVAVLVRYLVERGINAVGLSTQFEGERAEAEPVAEEETGA